MEWGFGGDKSRRSRIRGAVHPFGRVHPKGTGPWPGARAVASGGKIYYRNSAAPPQGNQWTGPPPATTLTGALGHKRRGRPAPQGRRRPAFFPGGSENKPMSPVWALFGLGVPEMIVLAIIITAICAGIAGLVGLIVLVALLATHRRKDEPRNE